VGLSVMCMWFYCCRWSYLQVSFQRCHYPNFLRGIPANSAQEAHTLLSIFTDCFPVLHVDCFKWILLDLCGCLDFSFFLLFLHCASIKHWRFIVCGIGLQKRVVWMVHTSCAAMTISRYKSAVLPGPFCLFFLHLSGFLCEIPNTWRTKKSNSLGVGHVDRGLQVCSIK
jgi:hypothetical protein